MRKKWTKHSVFEESKNYSSKAEFKRNCSGAFKVAYVNGWLKEMTWLKTPSRKPTKWTRETVFDESKKYSSITEFAAKNATAYIVAKKNGWLEEMPWLQRKYVIRGFWQSKTNVFEESHKYNALKDFRKGSPTAYDSAYNKGWLGEMTWLKKSGSKPSGFWSIKENIFEESHKYSSTSEFCDGKYVAYKTAKDNGWLEEMTWLKKANRLPKGYWNIKDNVLNAARDIDYKSEFRRKFPSAYASARLHNWLDEINFKTKESKGDPRGPIHCIYVYVDVLNKYAYVGATNDIKTRHSQHCKVGDAVYKHFLRYGIEIPKCKVLLEGLTLVERQREERIQSLYYRDVLHYQLINKINLTGENVGSVGSLIKKWSKRSVIREAEKYKTPTEFFTYAAGAYDAALKYKMMNKETFPWFYSNRMPPRWWNVKEHVFEESKKSKTWDEFFWKSPAAHNSARKHKWENEMVWLERNQAPKGYWQNEDHVIEESKKYKTRTAFFKGCHAAYDYTNEHNLWDKMLWIKMKRVKNGYWTKERVINEGKNYQTKIDFKKGSSTAYSIATKNKWINEMTWFVTDVKPHGYWQEKQHVIEESHKYTSRSEFRWGSSGAYRSAINNGWLDEMTWLNHTKNHKHN